MNLFGDRPQERAMRTLIHDTNRDTSAIESRIRQLSDWLKENGKKMTESGIENSSAFVLVEYLKSANKRIQDDIDTYYTKFSKDFEQ